MSAVQTTTTELYKKFKTTYCDTVSHLSQHMLVWAALFGLMYWFKNSWVGSCAVVPLMALMNVRTFTIFHDCGHQSYFPNATLNYSVGSLLGIWVLTPITWSSDHTIHHLTSGQTDNKYNYDFNVTVFHTKEQYDSFSPMVKTLYRVLRDPVVFFGVLPFIKFFFFHRFDYMLFSFLQKYNYGKELGYFVFNTVLHNIGLILLSKTLYEMGLLYHYMLSMYFATVLGTALFHNQHCFNPPYVVKKEEWSFTGSGMKGSSHILVFPILKYFTNGIEFHHIHHMMPRIAGHCLEKCHDFIREWKPDMLKDVHRLSIQDCFHNMKYTLYNAETKQFVSFVDEQTTR